MSSVFGIFYKKTFRQFSQQKSGKICKFRLNKPKNEALESILSDDNFN